MQVSRRVHFFWLAFFTLWGGILSGVFAHWGGSPGVLQALRLDSVLSVRLAKLKDHETSLARFESDRYRLEHNKIAQEREIRRVLGYAAADEIIFDFSRQ